jgi:hypothetical protein
MKKILLSLGSIIFVGALLAGGTGAFLADSGTSTGNTFASGIIDLKVDNESYVTDNWGRLVYSTSTSWQLSKLEGKLFFNFLDLKPGDIGEDTISLHVNNNNAWACMNVALTGTPENGQDEPETAVDPTTGPNDGELQNYLTFVFWADDGDNVYEKGEKIFKQGLVKDIWDGQNWPLADASTNIWDGTGPIQGDTTVYIGKAWCFGSMTPDPVTQDNKSKTGSNGPLSRGTGFSCSGADVGNIVQSDGVTADISFSVAQSRNNNGYLCSGGGNPTPPPASTSTIFTDPFNEYSEGHQCTNNDKNWTQTGGVRFDTPRGAGSRVADLSANSYNRTQVLTSNDIDLTGYHNVTLTYDRMLDDTDSPPMPLGAETLKVAYSANGGSSWTTLETVSGESGWTSKSFTLSPLADNKAHVRIRFTLSGQNGSNHAYIDNVAVTAVSP